MKKEYNSIHIHGLKKIIFTVFLSCFVLLSVSYISLAQQLDLTDLPAKEAPDDNASALSARVSYQSSSLYRIGSGDILSLSVNPQNEFSADRIIVRPDGQATFPKIGELTVTGKSIKELSAEVKLLLSNELVNHNVTIDITNSRPATIYLTGAVHKVGPFQMVTNADDHNDNANTSATEKRLDLTLSNVLANSGGVKLNADLSRIVVSHRDTGKTRVVNFWKVLKEGSQSHDPWLTSGDSIHVPSLPDGSLMDDADFKLLANSILSPANFPVRVIGQVKNPSLVKLEGETPLLSTAIAVAGGFNNGAMKEVVAVRRFTDEKQFTTLYVNTKEMDFMLRPNDVVYVGENKTYKAGRFMEQAANILSPFAQAGNIGANASQIWGFGGWRNLGN
ncbi:MAG: polysaccharide biosynthesis/export family protein [Cyanobacteria bacterium P01_H01_bin.74]